MKSTLENHSSLPLSPIQRAIWFGQSTAKDEPIYNTAYAFTFKSPIEIEAFKSAHQRLVTTTDSFRIVFDLNEQGEPQQRVLASSTGKLEVTDCSNFDSEELERRLHEKTCQRLNLLECPWSSTLYITSDGFATWHLLQHHLLTDGHSFNLILKRIGRLYQEELTNDKSVSHEPEFSTWLQRRMHDSVRTSTLPTKSGSYSRLFAASAPSGSSRGQRIYHKLSGLSLEGLNGLLNQKDYQAFSRDLGLSQLLLTVTFALIYRLEEKSVVTIGVSTHCRANKLDRETAGIFVEVAPLTISIEASDTFFSLFEKVQSGLFTQVHGRNGNNQSPEASSETDIVYNFLSGDLSKFGDIPTEAEWLYPDCHEPANRLRVHVDNTVPESDPKMLFDFIEEAFPGSSKATLLSLFSTTLEAFATNSNQLISKYTLVPASSPYSALARSSLAPPDEKQESLWQCFSKIAEHRPEHPAIVCDSSSLSYGELREWATVLSSSESFDQFSESEVVPIKADRSSALVAGSLAAMRIGKAFLPLDPELPTLRVQSIVEDSKAPGFLEPEQIHYSLNGETSFREEVASPEAYLIYTSGSTGTPNGVVVGHSSVQNLLHDINTQAPLEPGSRCLWWTAVGFDVSIYEVYSALLYGYTLCIPPNSLRSDATRLFEWMKEMQVNAAYLPPFFLDEFAQWLEAGNRLPLRRLLVGVEPIQEELLQRIATSLAGLVTINGYGPTEATVCATTYKVPGEKKSGRTPIGRPVFGNLCYVLDSHLNLKPRGTQGELYVGGAGLALGYWHRETLQNERFLDDPFSPEGNETRMYKTGDLVRMDDEGTLHFVGRIDTQLKLRGQRIEPSEIENVVVRNPAIERAIVRIATTNQRRELVCYYRSVNPVEASQLTESVLEVLPIYIVPKFWVHLDRIPITHNGKIDYSALPIPETTSKQGNNTVFTHPDGDVEIRIHSIFCEILKKEPLPANVGFFDLGGSSLGAMELLNRVNNAYDLSLTLRSLYSQSSVRELSTLVENTLAEAIENLSESEIDKLLEGFNPN